MIAPRMWRTPLAATAESTGPREVEILRDEWGVAHVYATTEEGAYYGWGYAMAEDRLESVLRHYLWGIGNIAELLRSGLERPPFWLAGDPATTEIEIRRWQPLASARAGVERLSPELRGNYLAFIAGLTVIPFSLSTARHAGGSHGWIALIGGFLLGFGFLPLLVYANHVGQKRLEAKGVQIGLLGPTKRGFQTLAAA